MKNKVLKSGAGYLSIAVAIICLFVTVGVGNCIRVSAVDAGSLPTFAPCPDCGENAELRVDPTRDPYYICYHHQPERYFSLDEMFPAPVSDSGSSTVQCTITYYEYKSSSNPSYVTRTVSVPQFSYYSLYSATINEYTGRDGVKYVFSGNWESDGTTYSDGQSIQITKDISFTPIYNPVYTVTYLNADKKTTFRTFEVAPNDYHRIISEYPEKKEDSKYTYEFAGWTFNDEVVKGYQLITYSKYYYPSYNKVPKTIVITYLDAKGNTYQEETVNVGAKFTIPTTGPKKDSTSTTGYEFKGWTLNGAPVDEETMAAGENMTFAPVYSEYKIKAKVTVTPVPEDETDEQQEDEQNDEGLTAENPGPAVTEVPEQNNDNSADNSASDSGNDVNNASESAPAGENAAENASAEETDEGEELDLEENTVPMGAVVAAGVGAVAVIAGAAVVITKTAGGAAAGKAAAGTVKAVKAGKAAKTAAKTADAAAGTAKAVRDIEFESKTVLLAVDDRNLKSELSLLLGKRKFVALKTTKDIVAESVANTAEKAKADIVIIDTLVNESSESFRQRVETICPKGSDCKLVAVSNDAFTSVSEDTFKALKSSGNLAGYTTAGASGSQKMVKLILPAYKPEITVDNSAEFIGRVTDALGIPGVSTVVELFLNGKEIKEALSSKDIDVSDISTVVGNIASIFGIDAVESVTELINGIDTARDVLKTEDVTDAD